MFKFIGTRIKKGYLTKPQARALEVFLWTTIFALATFIVDNFMNMLNGEPVDRVAAFIVEATGIGKAIAL